MVASEQALILPRSSSVEVVLVVVLVWLEAVAHDAVTRMTANAASTSVDRDIFFSSIPGVR